MKNRNPARKTCASAGSCCPCSSVSWLWLLVIAAVLLLAITIGSCKKQESAQPDIDKNVWHTDYDAAVEKAKQENKPLLLAFHASWCPPCNKMKKEVYPKPEVIETLGKFISVMIDSDAQTELARKHRVSGIPAFMIVRADGSPVDSFAGFLPPAEFVAKLNGSLGKI